MDRREACLGKVNKGLIRFKTIDIIDKVSSPVLIIHGKSDKVIPWKHSLALIEKCKCPAKLVSPERMEHNYFNTKHDIVANIRDFLINIGRCDSIESDNMTDELDNVLSIIHFPIFMFKNPKSA